MRQATCEMQCAICNMQRATCNMQHATCNMRHATCDMRHATYNMQHARRYERIPSRARATYNMQHATCDVRHATCICASAYRVERTAAPLQVGRDERAESGAHDDLDIVLLRDRLRNATGPSGNAIGSSDTPPCFAIACATPLGHPATPPGPSDNAMSHPATPWGHPATPPCFAIACATHTRARAPVLVHARAYAREYARL